MQRLSVVACGAVVIVIVIVAVIAIVIFPVTVAALVTRERHRKAR